MLQVAAGAGSSTVSSLDSGFVSQDAFSLYSVYHDPATSLQPPLTGSSKVSSATLPTHAELISTVQHGAMRKSSLT